MPVKTKNNVNRFIQERKVSARKFVVVALDLIVARSNKYVPIDTNNLINSIKKEVEQNGLKTTGTITYYADYALALHSPSEGGPLDGWQPRQPGERGKKNGGYNAKAKQGWTEEGAEEAKKAVAAAFERFLGSK